MISSSDRAQFTAQVRRRRGRPRVIQGAAIIMRLRVSEADYDALCRDAIRQQKDVAELARERLAQRASA